MNQRVSAKKSQSLSAAAALLLFALFALLAVGVLTAGMTVYQRVRANAEETYRRRTALSYVANQVRQADILGGVGVDDFHGQPAITLRRRINNTQYLTYIYSWDGALRELFFEEGLDLPPEGGVEIMPLEELAAEQTQEGLILLTFTHEGNEQSSLTLAVRSAEGAYE